MKGFNYPPQTGAYKVWINLKTNWQDYNACRLQVSVGNPRYEGEKFKALLDWSSSRFDQVDIVVSDTLQRHNVRKNLSIDPASAWKISRIEGDRWIERNLAGVNVPGNVRRWDDCLHHKNYLRSKIKIDRLYCENIAVRHAVDEKADRFGTTEFLLEELAVFDFMFERPAVDVYAGSWITSIFEAMEDTRPRVLGVDFIRNKAAA